MNYDCFVEYMNTHDPCSSRIGVRLLSVSEGEATAALTLTDDCRNIMGNMHGGAIATLIDVVAGCGACHHNRRCVTLDTSIRYLKGISGGTATATGKEIHASKHLSVCQVEVRDDTGDLCCSASVTMYLTGGSIGDMIDPKDREALDL